MSLPWDCAVGDQRAAARCKAGGGRSPKQTSLRLKFPLTGKFTGNFGDFADAHRFNCHIVNAIAKFSLKPNRELSGT